MKCSRSFNQFDRFVSDNARETNLPSVTAILIEDGRTVHSFAYGFRDIASASPASPNTLYGVGSVTKSFTALGVAKLVEQGKLGFHDKVTDYLPLKPKVFKEVEIHNLLTHSSGIPGLGYAEVVIFKAIGSYTRPLPEVGLHDMAEFLADVDDWVEAKPGEKFFYLNEGYYLLGEIISKVSGCPYEKYVTDEIFTPLGMRRTYFAKQQIVADTDRSTPYIIKGGKATPSVIPYGGGPAGGIVSNVVDLSHYVIMLIERGEFNRKRIVERETLEEMETPYVKSPKPTFPGAGYGYGLAIIPDFYGSKIAHHDGSVEVFTAGIAYTPHGEYGAVALANGSGYSIGSMALYGLACLMGKDPEELPMVKQENLLKRLVGKYAAYKNTVLAEVKRNGSFLMLSGEDIGENIILIPGRADSDAATFSTLIGTAKMEVDFRFTKKGIEMIYERYKYRKQKSP